MIPKKAYSTEMIPFWSEDGTGLTLVLLNSHGNIMQAKVIAEILRSYADFLDDSGKFDA